MDIACTEAIFITYGNANITVTMVSFETFCNYTNTS